MNDKYVVIGTRGIPNIMGGVETHCEELFPRIVQRGHDVTLIRRTHYAKDSLKEWEGIKIVDVDSPKKKCFEAIVHTFAAICKAKKLGADTVHIMAVGPALLTPFARLMGLKVVFTHHGPDYNRDKWGFCARTVLRLGEKMGVRYSNEVIVISNVIKYLIEEKYGRKNSHLIYNGVPEPEKCEDPEYFSQLGIEKGKYILGMCRFVPEKHLHDLIEAFDSLKGKMPSDIKLVLAGDADFEDDYSRNLKAMAREKGVVLTGFVKGSKLHSLLTNCRAYCLPSSHEGLPIALLEAMSYSVPVIVSDIPANLEVGLPEENYFPMGNVDALAERIMANVEAEYHHVEYNMSKYNWERIADQTANIYTTLAQRRIGNPLVSAVSVLYSYFARHTYGPLIPAVAKVVKHAGYPLRKIAGKL